MEHIPTLCSNCDKDVYQKKQIHMWLNPDEEMMGFKVEREAIFCSDECFKKFFMGEWKCNGVA